MPARLVVGHGSSKLKALRENVDRASGRNHYNLEMQQTVRPSADALIGWGLPKHLNDPLPPLRIDSAVRRGNRVVAERLTEQVEPTSNIAAPVEDKG